MEKAILFLGGIKKMLAGNNIFASSHHLIDFATICENCKGKLAQLCTVAENKGGKEHYISQLHSSRAAK